VIAIAAQNEQSHVAGVVTSSVTAFATAPPQFTDAEATDAAQRAFQRSCKILAADLSAGLGTLRTIASTAPFVGLMGTCLGIMNAFRGIAMSKSAALAMIASAMAEALVTTAARLLVAIPAVWCHNYLRIRFDLFKSEMSNAGLEATTYLHAHRQWHNHPACSVLGTKSFALIADGSARRSWEIPYDRQRCLLLGIGLCAVYLAYDVALGVYWHFAAIAALVHQSR
jgi:biopolymer transport protein ExbB/TolQ